MIEKFLKTIKKNNLIQKGDKVVMGISGGPDSMCMLHLFCRIQKEWSLSLYAVHLNHQYRGTLADDDATYVEEKCKALGVPLYSFSSNVKEISEQLKTSFENAGRQERYRLFFKVLNEKNAQKIAVAQNKNDQAETILMRLIRGAGIEGLCGIGYNREDGVIRPILDMTRDEIEAYCEQYDLNPRIDHTNDDVIYTRNKIRKELLPMMQEMNPSIIEHLSRTGQLLKDDNLLLEEITGEYYEKVVSQGADQVIVDLKVFNEFPVALKRRIIRSCIEGLRGLNDVTYDEVETVIQLALTKRTGAKKNYHGELTFEISYDNMIVYLGKRKNKTKSYSLSVREMAREEYDDYKLTPDEIAIDKEKIAGLLWVNKREPGDRFCPMGFSGQKKLKDFFINRKIPREERDSIPIVRDDVGIVWIVGYRQDSRYVVDEDTSTVLILQCMKL